MADRGRGCGRGYRGQRGSGGGRGGGRGGAGGRGGSAPSPNVCYDFQKNGSCSRPQCRFLHETNPSGAGGAKGRVRIEETTEQRQAHEDYNDWKKYLGTGYAPTDAYTMRRVWEGAVHILREDDRDWKQQLPRDLDDSTSKCNGRAHIKVILEKRATSSDMKFLIEVSALFLEVITHSSILDCLAVDTYVGGIYSFVSGANGIRAIPFFQHLCEMLVDVKADDKVSINHTTLEVALISLTKALCELLRRDHRARMNDDLDVLLISLGNASQIIPAEVPSVVSTIVQKHLHEAQAMIARAKGLVVDPGDFEGDETAPVHTTAGSYPRDLIVPNNRHDNDKLDIAEITIFPTREEITSDARDFLPSTDPNQLHFLTNKVERHIDTNFRLLRHDIFGDLKKALAGFMQAVSDNPDMLKHPRINLGDMRVYHYPHAQVSYLDFSSRRGLEAQISFTQPPAVRKKPYPERRTWWEESRRLDEGSLLSLIWIENSVVEHLFFAVTHKTTTKEDGYGLSDRDTVATISTKLLTQDHGTLQTLLRLSFQKTQCVLLEYPNIMPATFVPILENLQDMQRLSRLPFQQWILPDPHHSNLKVYHDIPPPLYARNPGFLYPLKSISKPGTGTLSIEPSASCEDTALIDDISKKTELDAGQSKALVAALTREFTFIQGPPGTGKSYLGLQIMKILLDIKETANLGPIIVVCYTNHALDQFLEHLLQVGITKILRVGGQSRAESLEGYNLRTVAQSEGKTKNEGHQSAMAYRKLNGYEDQVTKSLGRLHGIHRKAEWSNLGRHVSRKYPKIATQLLQVDHEGYQTVGPHPFDTWKPQRAPNGATFGVDATGIENIIGNAEINIHALPTAERQTLLDHWINEVCFEMVAGLSATVDDAANTHIQLSKIHDEADRRVLQGADVIGVTTSGLAKRISVLKHVQCKVIICEEAGEVMEPHMISALLPTVEHCIQIGDHEQLRPSINNFKELSLESKQGSLHQLDRSQFERLSVGERGRPLMPVAQLEVQRRMRPEVSTLIRQTIYPRLVDHPSTLVLPAVVGMRKNVFWLDHRNFEDEKGSEDHHTKSKSSPWEVKMVHALVRHVVRQGVYKSSDIAVLTPYTGQLQKLRTAMRNDFEVVLSERDQSALENDGFSIDEKPRPENTPSNQLHRRQPLEKKQLSDLLRVATVDNFQGEEAKIIIVSLVRSNIDKKVGFLKTSNRINVLLSRAQHGMFLIGNSETYSNVPMWQKVIDMLRASDAIGDTFDLCCPRHPEKIIEVRQPDDFRQQSPEGGCKEACTERLTDCGHQCEARCHSKAMHNVFRCEKPCQRRLQPCDHACLKKTCGEECYPCKVDLNDVLLPCSHIKSRVECYKTLSLSSIPCDATVNKKVPGCEHDVDIKCSVDVKKDGFKCPKPCDTILPCGHLCPGSCGRCNSKDKVGNPNAKHLSCTKKCGRKFGTCNHNCTRQCHSGTDCGLCQTNCEVRCKHSRCTLKCHQPCAPCVEPCIWECEHQGKCMMPCSAPCDRLPCNERCTKLLSCGHQCPSICGEECPVGYCQLCGTKADLFLDVFEGKIYTEIDIDESPIVVLGCGHFFTIETLDGLVGLKDVYEVDANTGRFTAVIENAQLAASIPQCPTCKGPIRQYVTQRYNRLINKAVIDEMSKRFLVSGEQELHSLEEQVKTLENVYEASRKAVVSSIDHPLIDLSLHDTKAERLMGKTMDGINATIKKRHQETVNVANSIKGFQHRTAAHHQPATKLHEATLHAAVHHTPLDAALAQLNLDLPAPSVRPQIDQRISLSSRILELRIHCLVLEDKFSITRAVNAKLPTATTALKLPGGSPTNQTSPLLTRCRTTIDDCNAANLPKLAVEATLYYAHIAHAFSSSGLAKDTDRTKATDYRNTATELLDKAQHLCTQAFRDHDTLLDAISSSQKLLSKEFYEEISAEEMALIRQAMLTGRNGIATHSGHWYKCENGHPFAVGQCGMPMEEARCPECGARIGGRNHTSVAGVTRAVDME